MKFVSYMYWKSLNEITININDPDIKKVGRGKWLFKSNNNEYKFYVDPITLKSGNKGFLVEWGLIKDDGTITTEIVGGTKNVIKIFSKVISCMAMFIYDENPNEFIMYANKKISKIYDHMWLKHRLDEPINRYPFRDREGHKKMNGEEVYVYHYMKNGNELTESEWIEIKELI